MSEQEQRERALALIEETAGPLEEMNEPTLLLLGELKAILGVGATPTPVSARRRRSTTGQVQGVVEAQ